MLVGMKNKVLGGVLRQIQHSASPRAVFVWRHAPHGVFFIQTYSGALTYTYVVLGDVIYIIT